MEFLECDTCKAKPGSPNLCAGCLNNRTLIGRLEKAEADASCEIENLNTLLDYWRARAVDLTPEEKEALNMIRKGILIPSLVKALGEGNVPVIEKVLIATLGVFDRLVPR